MLRILKTDHAQCVSFISLTTTWFRLILASCSIISVYWAIHERLMCYLNFKTFESKTKYLRTNKPVTAYLSDFWHRCSSFSTNFIRGCSTDWKVSLFDAYSKTLSKLRTFMNRSRKPSTKIGPLLENLHTCHKIFLHSLFSLVWAPSRQLIDAASKGTCRSCSLRNLYLAVCVVQHFQFWCCIRVADFYLASETLCLMWYPFTG